jgi:hypothetical protein
MQSNSKSSWTAIVLTTIITLAIGIMKMAGPNDFVSLWRLGLGTAHQSTLIPMSTDVVIIAVEIFFQRAILANMAQPFLSALVFLYTGLLTSMLQASEWSSYSIHRKGLRVSTRTKGAQRSTYILSLPLPFGVPLLTLSILLHFLASQSLFLVAIQFDALSLGGDSTSGGTNTVTGITTSDYFMLGYSPAAIMLLLMVLMVMMVGALILAWRRFASGMPLAGSCSLVIAAACHVVDGSSGMAIGPRQQKVRADLPLMWGVMGVNGNGLEHCGFAATDVAEPIDGRLYT